MGSDRFDEIAESVVALVADSSEGVKPHVYAYEIAHALRTAVTEERAEIRNAVLALAINTLHRDMVVRVIERVVRVIDSRAVVSDKTAVSAVDSVKSAFERLSDEDREAFMHSYCSGCGGPRRCQCQNDE